MCLSYAWCKYYYPLEHSNNDNSEAPDSALVDYYVHEKGTAQCVSLFEFFVTQQCETKHVPRK